MLPTEALAPAVHFLHLPVGSGGTATFKREKRLATGYGDHSFLDSHPGLIGCPAHPCGSPTRGRSMHWRKASFIDLTVITAFNIVTAGSRLTASGGSPISTNTIMKQECDLFGGSAQATSNAPIYRRR